MTDVPSDEIQSNGMFKIYKRPKDDNTGRSTVSFAEIPHSQMIKRFKTEMFANNIKVVMGYLFDIGGDQYMKIGEDVTRIIFDFYIQLLRAPARNVLEKWLPLRKNEDWMYQRNIVPFNYFNDPEGAMYQRELGKEVAIDLLELFYEDPERPTLYDLHHFNIIPSEFCDPSMDHHEAVKLQMERVQRVRNELNEKLTHPQRPTITDLGDMHIIPHEYLEEVVNEEK